jgi:photosystem II stability/assembly factor-like uncharacterized protein
MAVLIVIACSACHREVKLPPLPDPLVTFNDKFFDVWPTGPRSAMIVGNRGKLLATDDAGLHFRKIALGTDLGIFAIQMADADNGFLSGQDGLLMRTRDGGKSWERLNSRTHFYIFAMSFVDRLHGFLVGDRSLVLSTANGGESFFKRQLEREFPPELHDYGLSFQDPVLYGVSFLDQNRGWIAGEFGRIWITGNGGRSWSEQQNSLVKQWKRPLTLNEDVRLADFYLPTMFSVAFRDVQHGVAGGLEGWVIYTEDGGKNWVFAHQAERPGGPLDELVPGERSITPRDPLFAITLFGGGEGRAVGLTGTAMRLEANNIWAHDPNVPAIPFPLSQVRFFDAQHGWIVGYGTVLYTEDGGKSWRFCQG